MSEGGSPSLEYDVDAADVSAAALEAYQRPPAIRWVMWVLRFVAAPILLAMSLVVLVTEGFSVRGLFGAAFSAFWILGSGWALRSLQLGALRQVMQATPLAVGRKRLLLNPEGVVEHSELGSVSLPWGAISRVDVSPKRLILHSGGAVIVVPRERVVAGDFASCAQEAQRLSAASGST
jgi:hypothetical protein